MYFKSPINPHKKPKYPNSDIASSKTFMIKSKKLSLNLNYISYYLNFQVENFSDQLTNLNNLSSKEKKILTWYLFQVINLVLISSFINLKIALFINT